MSPIAKHARGPNIQIADKTINCLRSQKLLGIVFDNNLKSDKHIENIF